MKVRESNYLLCKCVETPVHITEFVKVRFCEIKTVDSVMTMFLLDDVVEVNLDVLMIKDMMLTVSAKPCFAKPALQRNNNQNIR